MNFKFLQKYCIMSVLVAAGPRWIVEACISILDNPNYLKASNRNNNTYKPVSNDYELDLAILLAFIYRKHVRFTLKINKNICDVKLIISSFFMYFRVDLIENSN